jgi:hypothetical protein
MFKRQQLLSVLSANRKFSTGVENPRVKIVQSVLKLQAIRAAANEKDLTSAVNGTYKIDINNLQPEIAAFKEYLSTSPAVEKFIPNAQYWHNKPFMEMVTIESQRAETWPFIVGGL